MYGDQFGGSFCMWIVRLKGFNRPIILKNPSTQQVDAQNQDFSTFSRIDLMRSLVLSVVQGSVLTSVTTHYFVTVITFLQLAFIILANILFLLQSIYFRMEQFKT